MPLKNWWIRCPKASSIPRRGPPCPRQAHPEPLQGDRIRHGPDAAAARRAIPRAHRRCRRPDPALRLAADPWVRLALSVGSRSLSDALERSSKSGTLDVRLRRKLLRYLIRMSTRPTPYGLFAGVALARFGSRTDLALADHPPRRRTRPDMAWLLNFVARLESSPEVRIHLNFLGNPAARISAGRVYLAGKSASTGRGRSV